MHAFATACLLVISSYIEMVLVRWRVTKQIWMHAISILIAFFFTLFLFPGIISEIQYCDIKDWMPVILITIFNLCDFIAKVTHLMKCVITVSQLHLVLVAGTGSY